MTLPCKECIAFAICNSHEKGIKCSILYEYFMEGGVNITRRNGSSYYDPPQSDRLKEIQIFFKRDLFNWSLSSEDVFFSEGIQYITLKWLK